MQYTEKFKLKKPDYTDVIDIQDLNDNADILENAMTTQENDTKEYVGNEMWLTPKVVIPYRSVLPGDLVSVSIYCGTTNKLVIKRVEEAAFNCPIHSVDFYLKDPNTYIEYTSHTYDWEDGVEEIDLFEVSNIFEETQKWSLGTELKLVVVFSTSAPGATVTVTRYDLRSFADGAFQAVSADYLQVRDEYLTSLIDSKADISDIGDIENALDNIIAIQNTLIGGDGV